ncbi:hypothetical protein CTAYLR_000170 [Chrysophaeum taylorii]|uniref:Uncharacterized protein n=1 Tax=Chrysophaeum taylorii TaxID=2483200 RepID=A0AAD7UIY1_9STRA|nr:hypothetical protein CTAYLR_000170 [Chrysophaeum taylorii]
MMGSDNGDKLPEVKEPKTDIKPVVIFATVPLLLGVGIASAIYKFGATDKYDAKIQSLKAADLQWTFLALVVLGRCIVVVNLLPIVWKQRIMTVDAGNVRSNPFIYKAGDKTVLFANDGDIGAYNRANRSLQHMCENYGIVLASLFAASQVFAFPVFVLTCVFALGRILHLVGYTKGYGKHAPGFMLATFATNALEGMLVVAAMKAFN